MRNLKQTSLFPIHTPGLLLLLCFFFFFFLLITVMLVPKLAAESAQKTFPGSGVVAVRQMPLRQDAVAGRSRKHTGFGESPLFPAATGSPKEEILCWFGLRGLHLTAAEHPGQL